MAGQRIDEGLFTICEAIVFSLMRYNVIALGIQAGELHLGAYAEILQDSMEGLAGLGTANIMHASVEHDVTTTEALQTATDLVTLFQDGYFITVLGQDTATGKTSQSTAYDDALLHSILNS